MPSLHPRGAKTGSSCFHFLSLEGSCINLDSRAVLKSITELNRSPTLMCQAVNPGLVAGRGHAMHSSLLAMNAFLNSENRAKSKELEFLLWLSGKRRLEKAIAAFGLESMAGRQEIMVIAASLKSRAEAESAVKKIAKELKLKAESKKSGRGKKETADIMSFYGITPKMIMCFAPEEREGAIENLVLEKVSLLALEG